MKPLNIKYLAIALCVFCCSKTVWSDELVVAAGAGYKRPFVKVYRAFEEKTEIKVSPIFGNMQQVLSQVKNSGRVGATIGDKAFLENSDLFEPFIPLGSGRLVVIYNKYKISSHDDLSRKDIVYIATPDPKKAIYGKAAAQFLERSGLKENLSRKIIVTATVPQVSSFVIAGSAEAEFVNITNAIAIQESIGGWIEIPQNFYDPIVIGVAVTKGWADKPDVAAFIKFIECSLFKS